MDEIEPIQAHFSHLNKLLEHRSRLAICSLLYKYDEISFRRFKELLSESDGNLGAQLKKLEDAEYIKVNKVFENRKPVSWYSITNLGQSTLKSHIEALKGITEL